MSTHTTPDPDRPGADTPRARAHDAEPAPVVASIIVPPTGPAECTLYPRGLPADEHVTTWITARDGSFVSLDEMR